MQATVEEGSQRLYFSNSVKQILRLSDISSEKNCLIFLQTLKAKVASLDKRKLNLENKEIKAFQITSFCTDFIFQERKVSQLKILRRVLITLRLKTKF